MYEEKEIKYKKRKKEKNKSKTVKQHKERKPIDLKKRIYNSYPVLERIDWKQLFKKLAILLIVIILIIFTISRINKHYKNQNSTFNNNLDKLIMGTLTYYQNNALPKNVGDSSSLVLEEMINLKFIDEIKDDNNKYCDYLNSYIILTKASVEEYRLKIYLKCPDKEKIKEEKMICNYNACEIKK